MTLHKKFATQNDVIVQKKVMNQASNPITLNKRITALGKEHKWIDIIAIYHNHKREMNIVNISTIYNQLSKSKSVSNQDPDFVRFLDETIDQIKFKGLHKIGARYFANILHAIAKLRLSNKAYSFRIDC